MSGKRCAVSGILLKTAGAVGFMAIAASVSGMIQMIQVPAIF